jgi:hypothetical protein
MVYGQGKLWLLLEGTRRRRRLLQCLLVVVVRGQGTHLYCVGRGARDLQPAKSPRDVECSVIKTLSSLSFGAWATRYRHAGTCRILEYCRAVTRFLVTRIRQTASPRALYAILSSHRPKCLTFGCTSSRATWKTPSAVARTTRPGTWRKRQRPTRLVSSCARQRNHCYHPRSNAELSQSLVNVLWYGLSRMVPGAVEQVTAGGGVNVLFDGEDRVEDRSGEFDKNTWELWRPEQQLRNVRRKR